MKLVQHLKRAGVITGPLSKLTRHTHLGMLLSCLCGNVQKVVKYSSAKTGFQKFGTRLHERLLLGRVKTKFKFTKKELRTIDKMLKVLQKHPVVQQLLKECKVREKTMRTKIFGVRFQYTPDAHGKITGLDYKTSAATKYVEFVKSAFDYGYFRQGKTYGTPLKWQAFYIIGQSKKSPHDVFIVHANAYKDFWDYAFNELEFLTYFYKNYGNFQALQKGKSSDRHKRNERAGKKDKVPQRKNGGSRGRR